MHLQSLRKLDATTAGVTLPKSDLYMEGLADPKTGEFREELNDEQVVVERKEEGRWEIRRVDID